MDSLTDHYIISGFGRVDHRLAEQLQRKSDNRRIREECRREAG
jgi:hypothetical protein